MGAGSRGLGVGLGVWGLGVGAGSRMAIFRLTFEGIEVINL